MALVDLSTISAHDALEWAKTANPGVWAQVERHYTNAPFHDEWYRLAVTQTRCVIVAPREHAKTECLTVNCTAWRSIYQPGTWTYVFANIDDQAKKLKERIDSAIYETVPELYDNAETMTATESVYANGSRVSTAGAGKAVRGAHPDVIIGDDVLEEKYCLTALQRKKTERWWLGTVGGMSHPGTLRLLPDRTRVTMPPTRVFLVGTPFHASDLLLGMRHNPIYRFYRYAAEYDTNDLVLGCGHAVEVA